jgi:hypothetical protein
MTAETPKRTFAVTGDAGKAALSLYACSRRRLITQRDEDQPDLRGCVRETPWAHAIGPGYVMTAVIAFAAARSGVGLLKGRPTRLIRPWKRGLRHGHGDGRPRGTRSGARLRLAGLADVSGGNAGGEVALNGMDADGACHRLIEVR